MLESQLVSAKRAVFLSYASEDVAAVQRIAEALRAAAIEVWFDQDKLIGGDTWDLKIRNQIKSCTLFIPVISAATQARTEGYFRREWKLAVDRTHDMADSIPFLIPVVLDGTKEREAKVPDKFREVQWTRLQGGETPGTFCNRVSKLLSGEVTSGSEAARVAASVARSGSQTPRAPSRIRTVAAIAVVMLVIATVVFVTSRLRGPSAESAKPVGAIPPAAVSSDPTPASPAASAPKTNPSADDKSIAVLAFVNLSDDRENEYFSDGITEELLNVLAKVPGLKVTARTSSFFFKGKQVPVPEIARQLAVAYVVEGTVRKSGTRVRITAQLIKAADGFHVWSKNFDRELKDIFAVQDEIAGLIVGQLRTTLFGLPGSMPSNDRSPDRTQNLAAHELFWRGRFEFNKKSPDGLTRSIGLYQEVVRLDPDFALAWAQLATARSWAVYLYGADRSSYLPAMQIEAARAASLAPDLAETQVALSELAMLNWQWKAARQASDHAVALAPDESDVLQMASFVAMAVGDNEAMQQFAKRALERDPFNVGAMLNLGLSLIVARDYTAAVNIARRAVTLEPMMDWGYYNLMVAHLRQNRPDEAAACVKGLMGARQMIAPALVAHARGNRAEADMELKRLMTETNLSESNPYLIADVYAFRGDADEAFRWLDRAYAIHSPLFCMLLSDALLQGLHEDPRWLLLLRKLELTAEQLK